MGMENDPSHGQHSSSDFPRADIKQAPTGLRVDTSEGVVYTFRRDIEAYEDGNYKARVPDAETLERPLPVLHEYHAIDKSETDYQGGHALVVLTPDNGEMHEADFHSVKDAGGCE